MFQISLSGFRVFETTPLVKVRPLTLITGGNSSGKTSFLAAIRMMSDLSGWGASPASFNKEPFYLGSFDQISHFRAGRYGRAKRFTFTIVGNPQNTRSPYYIPSQEELPSNAALSLSYGNKLGQPALAQMKYTTDDMEVVFSYSDDWSTATLIVDLNGEKREHKVPARDLPAPDMIGFQSIFISSAIEQMVYKYYSDDGTTSRSPRPMLQVSHHLRAAFGMIPSLGFVGGPVRTRPSRTYDPTDSTTQSEGAHVPSRMAQLARTHPTQWARTKAEIDKFGRSSGLFKDIQVRRLGKGDSDPFQINVSINGPRRNIVDVGYGVSQAIPIVFELATRSKDDLYMLQQPEVHLHPEAQAALGSYIVSDLKSKPGTIVIETHSDYLIDRVRRHIREGEISCDDVSLLYFERGDFSSEIHELEMNSNGEIVTVPPSYRQFFLHENIANLSF